MSEDKSKLELIGEIAQANNKNLELIEEINQLRQVLDEIRELVSHFSGGQISECSKELGMQIEKILDKVKE